MDFCVWAPWVFSALAGLIGWLFRGWYDDRKLDELYKKLQLKDDDIYHLHEAHELLLRDKERQIGDLNAEKEVQQKSIGELQLQLSQSEESTKTLLSQVVREKKKKSGKQRQSKKQKTAVLRNIEQLPFAKTDIIESEPVAGDSPEIETNGKSEELKTVETDRESQRSETVTPPLSDHDREIRRLRKEIRRLKSRLKKLKRKKKIIKEIPVTIRKTVLIKESLDKERLNEVLDEIPIIKTKETVRKKKKKGKPRIVKR